MKKLVTLALASLMAVTTLMGSTGCAVQVEKPKEGMTALYVNVTETGAGITFGDKVAEAFEAKYANESFEKGKTGVDVIVTHTDISTDNLEAACSNDTTDVIYAKTFDLHNHINTSNGTSAYLEDISDIIKEEDASGNTIEDRLFDTVRDYYNVGTDGESKYFALPWYSSYYGTVYDVDLFREKGLYYTKTNSVFDANHKYEGIDGIIGNADDEYGPDGKTGVGTDGSDYTLDDGLPATWDDFFKLMEVMEANDVIPFIFTNTYGYVEDWLQALWIDYEGVENWQNAKSFSGDYTYLDANGNEKTLTYSESNGYETANQYGKKLAVKIAEKIAHNGWYDSGSFNATTTHNKAQEIFIKSNIPEMRVVATDSKKEGKPIAMLMEGSWWENEARNVFKQTEKVKGEDYAYGKREFGYMPFPKWIKGDADVPATTNKDTATLRSGAISTSTSVVVVNKNSKKKELAKEFVKFAYSDEMLAIFSVESGMSTCVKYNLSEDDYLKMTPYQRNLVKYTNNSNVHGVIGATRSTIIVKNNDLVKNMFTFRGKFGEEEKNVILSIMKEKDKDGKFVTGYKEYWAAIEKMDYMTAWKNLKK